MFLTRPIFLFLVFLAVSICPLPAQENDGHVPVEKSGFALVKPQPWSPSSQASPLKFTAYTDRSARGTPGAGYFVFRVPNQTDRQIQAAQIVKVVPQPEVPDNISTQAECDLIKKAVVDFRSLSKAYPIAKIFIDEMIKPLDEEAVKFESGQIKINGVWKSKAEVVRQEVASYEAKLKQEFYANENPALFELESNIYYTELLEFAKGDAALSGRLRDLKAEHQRLRAREESKAIVNKLNDPALSSNEVTLLIKRLKALTSPDSVIRGLLNQVQLAETIELEAAEGRALIEAQFAPPQDFEKVPVLSPEARNLAQKLAQSFEEFKSSAPPAAIKVPVEAVKAVILIYEKLPSISSWLQAKDYLAANTALAALVQPSGKIGPHTRELIIGLQTLTTTKVASFTKLRDEAAALQKEGKSKPALAKYQEALAIMPSSQVSAEISRISQPEPPKKK
jgi:hypothetical protein